MSVHGFGAWAIATPRLTPSEAALLAGAAAERESSVSDLSHPTRRRTARGLASKGAVILQEGETAGWEPQMWVATITCVGWNALWEHHGGRHEPGCGGRWLPTGVCERCGAKRRLDAAAFDTYLLSADHEERAFLTSRTRLWCDEHGFARASEWTTDKTCRLAGSPYHERAFIRV